MNEDMQANPDYQLVMKFLQLIKPGDMDEEASQQMMMIGQRIQGGGTLSEKEREMFSSVVGAMPAMPEGMTPRETTGAAMMPRETTGAAMTEEERMLMQNKMPSADGTSYSPSSGVTPANNVMDMQQMMDAGIVSPTRPQGRPAPMRPQARPMR